MEELNKIKALLISEFEKKGDEKVLVSGNTAYTGNQIIEEINNQTEFGVNVIGNILKLSLDLLERGKETYPTLPQGVPDEKEMLDMLDKYTLEFTDSFGVAAKGLTQIRHANLMLNRMRSLAEKEMIGFAEWINKECWFTDAHDMWFQNSDGEPEKGITTQQLLIKYRESCLNQ